MFCKEAMSIIRLFFVICIFVLATADSYAEDVGLEEDTADNYIQEERYQGYQYTEDGEIIIPPGMELRKVGKIDILLPEGTKITKVGNRMITEGIREYIARRFLDIEDSLDKIKKEQDALKKEIEDLKKGGLEK